MELVWPPLRISMEKNLLSVLISCQMLQHNFDVKDLNKNSEIQNHAFLFLILRRLEKEELKLSILYDFLFYGIQIIPMKVFLLLLSKLFLMLRKYLKLPILLHFKWEKYFLIPIMHELFMLIRIY